MDKIDFVLLPWPGSEDKSWKNRVKPSRQLYTRGKIGQFGDLNFGADEVGKVYDIGEKNGWIPAERFAGTTLVGLTGEAKLFPMARRFGIAFYAYSLLA